MRILVLVAALAALAGCSMPYEGTSFQAIPKPERMAEGEHHEAEAQGKSYATPEGHEATGEVSTAGGVEVEKSEMDRTGTAFPNVAQPTKVPITSGTGYGGDAAPATTAHEGE